MAKATVLYYAPAGSRKANKTKALMIRLGVRVISVSDDDINRTVAELIGSDAAAGPVFGEDAADESLHDSAEDNTSEEVLPEKISEEMMVFHGFSEKEFDRALRELKKSHASVNLKAMVTSVNASWPFIKLYGEISRERDYIQRQKDNA